MKETRQEAKRKNQEYAPGELDVILSLVPTRENIERLAKLLNRSSKAIEIVYRLAYSYDKLGDDAPIQARKVAEAKNRLGIQIGPKYRPRAE